MVEVRLVIVGHLGIGVDHTPIGSARNLSGSGYACARGACVVNPRRTGLVARVGEDFDQSALERLGVDLRGVQAVDGMSAHFEITQHPDKSRSVTSELAVADHPDTWALPTDYERARHFHLATMPLRQQRTWLTRLRTLPSRPRISIDMFESHAAEDPEESRRLCRAADLAFMNEEEWRILFSDHGAPNCALVIKRGERGATYLDRGQRFETGVPKVETVDTTGAGEILAGAMLSLLLAGHPLHTALRHAAAVASAKVGEFGVDGTRLATALRCTLHALAETAPP
ncbi:carbohydrate kinase family protein [Streptomyces sp. NBC_01236]|uniref:carbohydrate kinase family protein n=1 Tax=Streptomyces sp. NBC_01236 TaxID=2903789 RepID=UPI002E13F491|nr:carbohydrate kinase family protein [Streptomyces sp. NBC_01236]